MAVNKVPQYLPVKNVPSTCTSGLQYLKPSMHGLNTQNTRLRITLGESSSPFSIQDEVLYFTMVLGTKC